MPDPKFTEPGHDVPREAIYWNPTVLEDACIGCGTCVSGCNRLVYRYDYEHRKAKVTDPLNCMVGCTPCANTSAARRGRRLTAWIFERLRVGGVIRARRPQGAFTFRSSPAERASPRSRQ